MPQLEGKTAIVTGGAAGYGEGIVRLFAAQGANVVIADIDAAKGSALAAEIGSAARFLPCDVSRRDQVQAMVAGCLEAFGAPHIVINTAGTTHDNQPMLNVDEATFDRIFAVNVKSIYHMAQAVVPAMREAGGGVILNVGSTAGIRPRPGLTWYNATKGAVTTLSKSMAVELAPDTPENRARFIATIPLGRFSRPSDVAAAALFLASDAAEFISGVEFPVDGARTV